jgi:YegS/Rv2252/BmrU family lipid kinase
MSTSRDAGVAIRRVLLVVNPAARRGRRFSARAVAALADAGVQCDTVLSERPGHAAELATSRAAGYDAVFTLGGDGTAMEVVGALVPDGPPVGILPGGTGNLIARALGIPLDVRRAVATLVAGREARIDLGRLHSGQRFAIGAGVGIDASMIADTPPAWKRRMGVLAYVLYGTAHALRRQRFHARVTVDGNAVEQTASAVLVANFGVLLSGLITLGDGIRYDDGMLDVCIFDPSTLFDAIRIARKLVLRDFRPHATMTYLRGQRITVETDQPLPAQADGELIGQTPFSVIAEPLAAQLLVPQPRGGRL